MKRPVRSVINPLEASCQFGHEVQKTSVKKRVLDKPLDRGFARRGILGPDDRRCGPEGPRHGEHLETRDGDADAHRMSLIPISRGSGQSVGAPGETEVPKRDCAVMVQKQDGEVAWKRRVEHINTVFGSFLFEHGKNRFQQIDDVLSQRTRRVGLPPEREGGQVPGGRQLWRPLSVYPRNAVSAVGNSDVVPREALEPHRRLFFLHCRAKSIRIRICAKSIRIPRTF